jgi:hypothetical protein
MCTDKGNCSLHADNEWSKCRYGGNLLNVLCRKNTKEILRIKYENDYQGFVNIDALLDDGRVFSYNYSYGSCSGCDEWEDRELKDAAIEEIMSNEATYFDDIDQYNKWLLKLRKIK